MGQCFLHAVLRNYTAEHDDGVFPTSLHDARNDLLVVTRQATFYPVDDDVIDVTMGNHRWEVHTGRVIRKLIKLVQKKPFPVCLNQKLQFPAILANRSDVSTPVFLDVRGKGVDDKSCNISHAVTQHIILIRKRCGADTRIVVLGVSMGAMAVMHAIGQSDEIDAAVEDCGPTDMERILEPFSMSISKEPNPYLRAIVSEISAKFGAPMEENRPVDGVARSNTPLLILQGEADSLVSVQHAKDIMEVTRNPLSRMKTFRGREHAYSIQDYDIYGQCLKEFLNDIFG